MTSKSNRRLRNLTAANLVFLLVLCALEAFVAERHWLTTLITYAPQQWSGLPLLVLLPWALVRRAWKQIALNLLALGIFVTGPLGLVWGPGNPVPVTGNQRPVRVMTWNIHHAAGGVGRIKAVVDRQHPDVVCFQEANDGYWKSDVLPGLRRAFKGWHKAEFREVVTFSRRPIASKEVHRLMPETGRVVLETVTDVEGERLTVYNTHLNVAVGGRSLHGSGLRGIPAYLRHTAEVRLDQVRDLEQVTSAARNPSIIVGDFNTPPRGWCYRRIAGRYQDAFKQAGSGFGYTYPARRPLMRIDYVFTDGETKVRRCLVPKVTGSDHLPVVAELVVKE